MARVILPLFNFQYSDRDDFAFSDGRLSIRQFNTWSTLPDREIFSQRDRDSIGAVNKALVAEASDLSGYALDATLLLITFRLLAQENRITPIIKYRLSDVSEYCSRIDDTEKHIQLPGYLFQVYSPADFPEIDRIFVLLRSVERTSQRLKNALYFIYRAFNSAHWIDAFLFYMGALEALFSLDRKGPARTTICGRAAGLLNDPNWSFHEIEELYDIRSRIAHGRLEAGRDSTENLQLTARMEVLVKRCMRRLVEIDALKHYSEESTRTKFLSQFD
jgi:hypothetical protein